MEKFVRFSVSLPVQLLDQLDNLIKATDYVSRSEFARDLIRDKITKNNWENPDEDAIAILVIAYDHHEGELVMRKMDIEHDAQVQIICTNHVHIDHHNCLETMIIKGKVVQIEGFSNKICGLKGVKFSDLIKASVPEY